MILFLIIYFKILNNKMESPFKKIKLDLKPPTVKNNNYQKRIDQRRNALGNIYQSN
jgi:hypothetical protein